MLAYDFPGLPSDAIYKLVWSTSMSDKSIQWSRVMYKICIGLECWTQMVEHMVKTQFNLSI